MAQTSKYMRHPAPPRGLPAPGRTTSHGADRSVLRTATCRTKSLRAGCRNARIALRVRCGNHRAGSPRSALARCCSSSAMVAIVIVIGFLIAAPILVWLVYAGKVKTAGKPLPLPPRQWPAWAMIASLLAFAAWAYALPDSPFCRFGWYTEAVGAFVILAASTVLGLLAPIVQRPLTTA